ncbi:MAG TPA: type II CRISPR RNA-guided endonuclease Cas9 [Oscillospiraceae bacterium]|nr:type II CRISPR RNA-guided endonuclease Cas9 [Oscillospiraceae bacterium]
MKKIQKYDIGIDIGTNSVGYSVTDENGKLLKFKNQNMWGVRLFDSGVTAELRRTFRSTRRRYDRRKRRIKLLQEIMFDDVALVDEHFYLRLKESALWNEDKSDAISSEIYTIFNHNDFTEKDYYKDFPTIYHLRKYLCSSNKKEDIRLIYLALHNIVKYRGNFLYEDNNSISAKNSQMLPMVEELYKAMTEYYGSQNFSTKELSDVLSDGFIKKADKQSKIIDLFGTNTEFKKPYSNISKALVGNKADFNIIFGLESESKNSYYLSDEDIDSKIQELIDDEQNVVFEAMKKVYSAFVLNEILSGDDINQLSDAMIQKYEKHKKDLKELQGLVKDICSKKEYDEMFRGEKSDTDGRYTKTMIASYTSYILGFKGQKSCPKEDFYGYCNKLFAKYKGVIETHKLYKGITTSIENSTFMPKITSKDNGTIPYQLHLEEFIKIIENQGKFYPNLLKNKEKLSSLVTFRVPYYIGPLNEKRNPCPNQQQFAWLIRKEEGEIFPWNLEQKVDIDASADEFIKRMRNKCTYLPDEDVIPKYSLLYSEFEVRNEIKQIKLNDRFLELSDQKALHDEFFTVKKAVTEKDLRRWLIEKKVPNASDGKLTGFQKEGRFASSLTSYIDFKNIFDGFPKSKISEIEKIIYWITVFEDKKILRRKLRNEMPDITESQCDKICNLKYTGWSRLSRKLLEEIYVYDNKGQRHNIIGELCNTTKNLMQIITDKKLGFAKEIEKEVRPKGLQSITIDIINELAGSPAIKRGIKQAVDVVDEIVKIMKSEPVHIYIEFAREEGKKKRTVSRYKQLTKVYEDLKNSPEFVDTLKQLKHTDEKLLNDKMVYLYFLQNCKSMYSGKPIALENISQTCQIDHIIPQSYIKDDSIDNTVLVLAGENQDKSDHLLISDDVRRSCYSMWKNLYDKNLMSAKKFYNLSRTHFVDNDLKGFINRQIVETRQISKHVANLFTAVYKDTKIVQIKAQLSSDFRYSEGLYKCREINDFHHAHDAFIASTLGRYIKTCFPHLDDEFDFNSYRKYIKDIKNNKNIKKNEFGYIINNFRSIQIDKDTAEVLWDGKAESERIRKCLNYKDCFISRMVEEQTGEFYKQTILPKSDKKGAKLIPLKASMPVYKYGGYTSSNQAFYVVIEFDGKKKREKGIIGIPIQIAKLSETNPTAIDEYLLNLGYKNVETLKDRIMKYQKILYEGNELYLVSSNETCNARQLILPQSCTKTIYFMNNPARVSDVLEENLVSLYDILCNKISTHYPQFSKIGEKLEEAKQKFIKAPKEDKVGVINQILTMLRANSSNTYLGKYEFIELRDRCDRRASQKFDLDKITFVNTSVTGMFENKTKLV